MCTFVCVYWYVPMNAGNRNHGDEIIGEHEPPAMGDRSSGKGMHAPNRGCISPGQFWEHWYGIGTSSARMKQPAISHAPYFGSRVLQLGCIGYVCRARLNVTDSFGLGNSELDLQECKR